MFLNFNLAATGLVGGLLEVLEESIHLTTGTAGLCQGCLQGNGVLGVTEPGTQVRIRAGIALRGQLSQVITVVFSADVWLPGMYSLEMTSQQKFQTSLSHDREM